MAPQMHTYHGYTIAVRDDKSPPVAVFDTRFPRDPAAFLTDSLDKAKRWVDDYRKGVTWAAMARLSAQCNSQGKQYTSAQLGTVVYDR
jgi:hypothetical protein